MKWNDLSMTERAAYIRAGVNSGLTNLNDIHRAYYTYANGGYLDGNNVVFPKRHRYDGSTEETQQMQMKGKARTAEQARLYPYYDEDYDTSYAKMPSGKTFRNQEALERAIPTLDELVVYPESGKGAKSNTMGGYYDRMNSMTEANREHAARVAEADNIVRETAAFEKPLNFLSPGQWFGAGVDYLQGESPFWKGIYDGNSGWLPDKFAEDNPRLSTLINMLGDGASSYIINGIRTNITNSPKYLKYTPNTLNRKIGVGTIGYEDLLKSNIVRGKEGAPIASAATMRKMQRAFERSGVSKATREKLNSQQVDKEAFNEIKKKMSKNSRYNPFEEVETFEEYLKDKEIRDLVFKDNIRLQNKRIIDGYDWLPNWGDNSPATFAYPDEFFNPKFKFSGDYAVQIRNASKYAKEATKLGHFSEHPTTEYPIELDNPDLSIYVKEKSLNPFRRKTRYVEIPKYKVYEDQLRIKNGETIKNTPSFRKIEFPTVFDPYIDYSISNESNK